MRVTSGVQQKDSVGRSWLDPHQWLKTWWTLFPAARPEIVMTVLRGIGFD
jgi:hypothetical protein